MARIIVIGAGVAGLAAAARMAGTSNEVSLLERSASPGGALRWDGPYTLTLPAVLRDLFIKTGGRKSGSSGKLEDRVELVPVDPVRRYVFADGSSLALPNTARGATKTAFDECFGVGAGEAWLRILDHGNRAWSAIRPTLVEVPDAGTAELRRLLKFRTATRRALAPRQTLRQIGEAAGLRDARALQILDEYALGAGVDPRIAPAVLAVRPYLEHAFGAWRVVGGLPKLAEAMHERCLERGVDVQLGTEATHVAPGRVTLADGRELAADVIVAAVDTHALARLTGSRNSTNSANSASAENGDRYDYSPSIFSVRIQAPAELDLPHESVLFGEPGKQAATDGSPGIGPDLTIRVHAAPERPGELIAHVDVPADSHGAAALNAPAEANRVMNLIAQRLKLPESDLVVREWVTPADRERITGAPGGAVHGPAIRSLESALLRSPTVQPMRGLLHIGASSRPGPGIAFAALSAWNAAEVLKPTRV